MDYKALEKLKKIPIYLIPGCGKFGVPGMIKRHVAKLHESSNEQWRLFAEGCLRNRYFRDYIIDRSIKCLACGKKHTDKSRIEQHHNDYLWNCIGNILDENSPDIQRKAVKGEFPHVPDCRQCRIDNPEHFNECQKRIYGVHAACHERIHDKERYFRTKAAEKLKGDFNSVS